MASLVKANKSFTSLHFIFVRGKQVQQAPKSGDTPTKLLAGNGGFCMHTFKVGKTTAEWFP